MKDGLKSIRNQPKKSSISELRNQSQEIPLTRVARPDLLTNISAAC